MNPVCVCVQPWSWQKSHILKRVNGVPIIRCVTGNLATIFSRFDIWGEIRHSWAHGPTYPSPLMARFLANKSIAHAGQNTFDIYNKSQYLKIFLFSTETVFANTKRDRVWPSNAIFGPRLVFFRIFQESYKYFGTFPSRFRKFLNSLAKFRWGTFWGFLFCGWMSQNETSFQYGSSSFQSSVFDR